MPSRSGTSGATKCPAPSRWTGSVCCESPSPDTETEAVAFETGAKDASRASTATVAVSPGSIVSATETDTGSGDDCDNQRAACRQNSSWLRSVEAASMRQRQDASPPNTIERPLPYF